jgi:surface antigen
MIRTRLGALAAVLVLTGCVSFGASAPSQPVDYGPSANGGVGLIGTRIGAGIDDTDRRLGLNAEYRALEYGDAGAAVDWGGRGGVSGVVVPGPRYGVNANDCRQITETLMANNATQSVTATACRGGDGIWRIIQ